MTCPFKVITVNNKKFVELPDNGFHLFIKTGLKIASEFTPSTVDFVFFNLPEEFTIEETDDGWNVVHHDKGWDVIGREGRAPLVELTIDKNMVVKSALTTQCGCRWDCEKSSDGVYPFWHGCYLNSWDYIRKLN